MKTWTTAVVLAISAGLMPSPANSEQSKSESHSEPDPAIVTRIEELGGTVRPIAQNEQALEVNFHLGRNHEGLRRFESTGPNAPDPPPLDSELAILKRLENVVVLHLGGTDLTDAGLPHLASLGALTRLHLEKTKVSDAGLVHLKTLSNLSYLNLYQTPVTDGGLRHLENLKQLRNLYLWQSKVTPAGATKLQDAIPGLVIHLGGDTAPSTPQDESSAATPRE